MERRWIKKLAGISFYVQGDQILGRVSGNDNWGWIGVKNTNWLTEDSAKKSFEDHFTEVDEDSESFKKFLEGGKEA